MNKISVDWLVGIVCALCALMMLAIDLSYSAGVKDGTSAANGVCKITCNIESKESKEIRSIIEKKTLEALRK